jgi:cytoskeleton protein RodZ
MATNASSVEAATQAVEFGASMREMRRADNRELTDVSAILKIRLVYLQAIEDGRFNALPGPTYAMGFVRAYADYLGLDLVEVMRRYREITGDQPAQGPLVPPSPVIEARLPTGFILLVAAVLALAAYGGWYYLMVDGRDPVEVVTKLPARIAAMVGLDMDANDKPLPAATAKPDAENKENAAAAASSSPSSNMPSPETAVATASVSSPGGKPVVTVSAALPEAQAASAFATGRVILRASAITWVELRDASGKRLYSRLMKRGETFTVPPTGGVVLETGNAGGLDILVDGTAIASLGPQGAVRRGILLEPDTLLGGASGRR